MEVNADARPATRKVEARRQAKIPVTVSFGPDLVKQIDDFAARRNLSRSGAVSMAVTESLERWDFEKKMGVERQHG